MKKKILLILTLLILLPLTIPAAQALDLEIEDISWSTIREGEIIISANVKSTAGWFEWGTIDPFHVAIYINGILEEEQIVYNLQKKGDYSTQEIELLTETFSKAIYDIKVVADSAASIEESDETNNELIETLQVLDSSERDMSLILHLPFDEGSGSIAEDISGYGNDGNLVGEPQWVAGKKGQALEFDGANDYVDYGASTDFNYDISNDFTYGFWVNVPNSEIDGIFISQRASSKGNPVVDIILGYNGVKDIGNGELGLGVRDDSGGTYNYDTIDSNTVINNEIWHYIAAVRNTATDKFYLYVDGVFKGSAEDKTDTKITTDMRAIGSERQWVQKGFSTPNRRYFKGTIDDVKVWNRALSGAEIALELQTCKDSDKGKNYEQKGTTTAGSEAKQDRCPTVAAGGTTINPPYSLQEYFCSTEGTIDSEIYDCSDQSQVCCKGACMDLSQEGCGCTDQTECVEGLVCTDGHCCPGGKVWDGIDERCEEPAIQCQSDQECVINFGEGYVCIDQTCVRNQCEITPTETIPPEQCGYVTSQTKVYYCSSDLRAAATCDYGCDTSCPAGTRCTGEGVCEAVITCSTPIGDIPAGECWYDPDNEEVYYCDDGTLTLSCENCLDYCPSSYTCEEPGKCVEFNFPEKCEEYNSKSDCMNAIEDCFWTGDECEGCSWWVSCVDYEDREICEADPCSIQWTLTNSHYVEGSCKWGSDYECYFEATDPSETGITIYYGPVEWGDCVNYEQTGTQKVVYEDGTQGIITVTRRCPRPTALTFITGIGIAIIILLVILYYIWYAKKKKSSKISRRKIRIKKEKIVIP